MTETSIPGDLRYSEEHEWVKVEEGNRARIGITDYAQDALTDIVYAELPSGGDDFRTGDSMGVVESTKSVSDVFAPLSGKVVEVNASLDDNPELLNDDPYGKGWICVVEMSDPGELEKLLDADGYRQFLESKES